MEGATYPVELIIHIFLKSFLRQDTQITDVSITLFLPREQNLTLGEVSFRILLLARDKSTILGLLSLCLLQLRAEFVQLGSELLDIFV
jgi:hypothetical protein